MTTTHVVSLALSKKLREVGYEQRGEFWWWINKLSNVSKPLIHNFYAEKQTNSPKELANWNCIVAPIASEIMERLPACIDLGDYCSHLKVFKNEHLNSFCVEYPDIFDSGYEDNNLCNACAKMYIYLAENGLLEKETQ